MSFKREVATRLVVPARAYIRHAPTNLGKQQLLRRFVDPVVRRVPRTFTVSTTYGARLSGTTADAAQRSVYLHGAYQPTVTAWLRTRLQSGRTLIDVGANAGYFTLLGAKLVGPEGHVVAIEPQPEAFAQLQDNVRRNNATNVRALNVAATDQAGPVTVHIGDESRPSAKHSRGTKVDGAPLSELLGDEEIATAAVIRLHASGAEAAALAGLEPVLKAMPDDVELLVEVSPARRSGAGTQPDPLQLLAQHGFNAYAVADDGALPTRRGAKLGKPQRFDGHIRKHTMLIFSRTDSPSIP